MPSHLNVPTKYWELTKEVPPPPVERDIKSWIIANPSDPLWDIDVLPLTYTDSRWSAFVVSVTEDARKRLWSCLSVCCDESMLLEEQSPPHHISQRTTRAPRTGAQCGSLRHCA